MNVFNLQRAFQQKKDRGWEKLYFLIDLHETIIEGKYSKFNEGAAIYPGVKEFFNWARSRKDIVLILWTCSHMDSIAEITTRLGKEGITFDFINCNPECQNTEICDFSMKPYFNVLIDDKASFEAETDWTLIKEELKRIGEWHE